jgi:hypothetical protein
MSERATQQQHELFADYSADREVLRELCRLLPALPSVFAFAKFWGIPGLLPHDSILKQRSLYKTRSGSARCQGSWGGATLSWSVSSEDHCVCRVRVDKRNKSETPLTVSLEFRRGAVRS